MTAKHNLHTAALIPPHLAPADVIAALHNHDNALSMQAVTTGHKKLPETKHETKKDTYWYPVDLHEVHTYEVTECITLLPGIGEWGKKYLTFPSCFQDTPHGVKTRADAPGGVTLRAEYRVIKGGAGDGEVDGEGEGVGYADWVLVEDVEVQCAWYMMPFVKGKMEAAHRDICKKIVEMVEMEKRQEQIARTAAKGKGRADEASPTKRQRQQEDEEKLPDKITYG